MNRYSVWARWLNKLRTINLDNSRNWPRSVGIVSADEEGPLVISFADATVFPDGSVKSGGHWFISERFGLTAPSRPTTGFRALDVECGFVPMGRKTHVDFVTTFAPRVATLGKVLPGLPVRVPSVRFPLAALLTQCGVTHGGVSVPGGTACRVVAALFARVPTSSADDPQCLRCAQLFSPPVPAGKRRIYLENDNVNEKSLDVSLTADMRFAYEKAGSELISLRRFASGDIVRLATEIGSATEIIIESESLRPFTIFASPSASVAVASTGTRARPDGARVIATSRFDMDDALRTGSPLPRGVEVVSKPDYEIPMTAVTSHTVFDKGQWRAQRADVLVEKSLGPWILSVKNAILAPNGSVMLEDGTVLGGTYFGQPGRDFEFDGWIASESDRPTGFALTDRRGFGHGLLQIAPRLDALSRYDPDLDLLVPKFGWDVSPLIERLGVSAARVHQISQENQQHFRRVPQLFVSTQLHPESRTARADPVWLSDFVKRFAPTPPTSDRRKVYFARDASSGVRGGCVNREIVDELAMEFGYDRVIPESLSFPDQISLVSSTTDMFGERGSALNWAGFMPTGSRLAMVNGIPISPGKPSVTFHNPIMAARASSFHELNVMRAGTHLHFEVDPKLLRRALDGMNR